MMIAGYFEKDEVFETVFGVPQGGILSPLLANVYLNDFDWLVGRMYHQARFSCQTLKGHRRTLRYRGIIPKFLFRYADDWIILTSTENEAYRLLKRLRQYFKYKLKLELSEEKTFITNLTEKPATFLQFNIIAEPPIEWVGKTCKRKLVGKNYPNFEKVKTQVRSICDKLSTLKHCANEKERAVVLEHVNSMIVGVMEYWKTGICSKTYKYIDHKVYISAMLIFKKLYPENFKEHIKPLNQLANRPQRHSAYKGKTFAVSVDDLWIGITKAALTHSQWEICQFNQEITPYSDKGRKLIAKTKKKSPPLPRPPLYNAEIMKHVVFREKSICNFEYYMNREYAYNRDRGRCRICGETLRIKDRTCHRIDTSMPIDKINKVPNLAWMHKSCQSLIKSDNPLNLPLKQQRKVERFRNEFNKNP